ncbi:MAG: discoidin domain-containing protein [Pontiellaceae bacterium]|nr:discoidin domain-containing protein [Pontiellaceae bacterium]MBN2786197.1 discoidin domain-containing protein [Pontiellaceae bacterium]
MKQERHCLSILVIGLAGWCSCIATHAAFPENAYIPYPAVESMDEGISWPKGQALPIFAKPASPLDMLVVQDLSKDEQITFSALQGLVNRKQPRILLLDRRSDEGMTTWPETAGLALRDADELDSPYELIEKYEGEIKGVVLYDPEKNPHYRNLAGTVAGIKRALPVTSDVYEKMKQQGIELPVSTNLTRLELDSSLEIYEYLYENYWDQCDKRLIVSAGPGHDFHHTRDIAAAVGAAVVWLDNREPAERDLMRKFFGDMKAGEAIVLGWYTTERSGITTASEFGIGTLPADFFMSGSVYAGTDHTLRIPKVPKMPKLENKVYVAVFISDGDNIQYCQHAMRKIWDNAKRSRGKVALNWTISPGLADIAPCIMNYYYDQASDMDCFTTGPSGMGYMMPCNTLDEPGAPVAEYTQNPDHMDGYARLTETYLQRTGLRVMTIWDNASPMQRKSYERHGRNLYGATVQNFRDVPSVESSVENRRLRFEKLVIPYASTYEHIHGSLLHEIEQWDGRSPLFLAYQIDIWGEMKPHRIVDLARALDKQFPGKAEFVRADHYFNLQQAAERLPYNLSMAPDTLAFSSDPNADSDAVIDGTPTTLWTTANKDAQLGFDFGAEYRLSRCVIRHAGAPDCNTRDFAVSVSTDRRKWKTIAAFRGNSDNVTDVEFPMVSARYLKITVFDAGQDARTRIADVEIFGRP